MTDNNHPITPSPELVERWCYEDGDEIRTSPRWYQRVCAKAARWGADQQLEACNGWLVLNGYGDVVDRLRDARRFEPPSLKEQALEAAQRFYANGHNGCNEDEVKDDFDTICRALNSLPD